jgi:hypothetical protein
MDSRTEQCQRLYSGTSLCDGRSWGNVGELLRSQPGSHCLENRKAESQNVYQHVADGHSHLIWNCSGLIIRTCTNLKFVKHHESGRGTADGRSDHSSVVLYVALGFRTNRLTEITLKRFMMRHSGIVQISVRAPLRSTHQDRFKYSVPKVRFVDI